MKKDNKRVIYWLLTGCVLIFIMVVVGGITRLTQSGLSISNYKLISGTIPPMNEVEWNAAFDLYKQYPEYQKLNNNFELKDFKDIYFWEWLHRVIGRFIGLVFLIPFLFFLIKKQLSKATIKKSIILLTLGGFQGFLGWYMVKSGLVDNPDVSHFRLSLHLTFAFITFAYTLWVALDLIYPTKNDVITSLRSITRVALVILLIQIIYGGFVAGLNAGLISDTWPLMMGQIIPDGLFYYDPWYMNLFNNPLTLHFQHRTFAYAVGIIGIALWWNYRSDRDKKIVIAVNMVLVTIFLQIILGVLTIINMVPIPLAAAHQAGAVVTLSAGLYLLDRLRS